MKIEITTQEIMSNPNDFSLGQYVRQKYRDEVELRKQTEISGVEMGFEICVQCGKKTNIPVELDIDYRTNYIEGAGQGCDGSCRNI